jgi:serine/threonine-protein kinase
MVAAMNSGASDHDGELRPGDVCEGYRVVSLIAAGGMGDVYEAVHLASGKTVALKCLKLSHREKEDARSRMKMEAVVLAELRHANLVQVYDAGVTDAGTIWIAMERLHGQTLRDLIRATGRLTIPDALYFACEVADGVVAVHDANVVHRDLKPENVFITDRKLVKVLDLGTGKFSGYGLKSTDGSRVVGTTAYMSPEQIKGLRVDPRADVYALGLITYEMIAGRHPLAGSSGLPRAIEQVALLQLQTRPRPLSEVTPGCPPYLSALVDKAMAKDREQRHATMGVLSSELRAARKRFIAENRLDESAIDLRAAGDVLRQKLGAPPRATPLPPAPDRSLELAKTELQGPPDFTMDNSIRVEVSAGFGPISGREPTLELSMSSVPSRPPGPSHAGDASRRSAPSGLVNLPTRTNPLGLPRAGDLTPEPLAVPDDRRAGRRPRRLVLTLVLGAVIGVPPAIFGAYWWNARRQATTPAADPSPPIHVTVTAPDPTETIQPTSTAAAPPILDPPAPAPPPPVAATPREPEPVVPPSPAAPPPAIPRVPHRRALPRPALPDPSPAPLPAAPVITPPRALPSSGL